MHRKPHLQVINEIRCGFNILTYQILKVKFMVKFCRILMFYLIIFIYQTWFSLIYIGFFNVSHTN